MVCKAVGGMVSEAVDKVVGDKYCDVFGEGAADLDGDVLVTWFVSLAVCDMVQAIGDIISEADGIVKHSSLPRCTRCGKL